MARVPLGGRSKTMPTLIPNFDRPYATGGGQIANMDPADYIAQNPRTDATVAATIGGTVTAADTVTLTLTCGTLPNGSLAVSYTAASGDTVDDIANELADAINSNSTAQDYGIYAEVGGHTAEATITIHWEGPVGNYAVLSDHVSGSATETVTLNPSSGDLSGGAGPVICSENFNYTFNGSTMSFFIGQPYPVGGPLLAAMVKQGASIV